MCCAREELLELLEQGTRPGLKLLEQGGMAGDAATCWSPEQWMAAVVDLLVSTARDSGGARSSGRWRGGEETQREPGEQGAA